MEIITIVYRIRTIVILIIKSSHHLPNVSNYTISWTAMQISSKDENLLLPNEYSDIRTDIHRDTF